MPTGYLGPKIRFQFESLPIRFSAGALNHMGVMQSDYEDPVALLEYISCEKRLLV